MAGRRKDPEADIPPLSDLGLSTGDPSAYEVHVLSVQNDAEQHMLDEFHQQYVAVEGHSAMVELAVTRIGDIATNTALSMATTIENIEQIEAAAQVSRLRRKLEDFNNKLIDHTGRLFMETDAVGVRTIQEDMRRDVYKPPLKPPPPPRPPRKKGLIPTIGEFLFGEE